MSGFGERFRKAGYQVPKPLIHVEGKPIIGHVVDMFPGENKFIFICNKDHLRSTNMIEILEEICVNKDHKIVPIEPHKLGPVYAVSKIFDEINIEAPAIVNYCDFTCYWNFHDFLKWTKETACDGALPAYRGFHPHSLGNTNYAYIRENCNQLQEIKEKEPFTSNRMDEYASSGTYYFSRGEYIKKYFSLLLEKGISLNGEYYCSLVYNLMNKDNLCSRVYELKHFMQWGTPEDVQEYMHWSSIFHMLSKKKISSFVESYKSESSQPLIGSTVITMAGNGSRFTKQGYKVPKPLINVNQQLMFKEAFCSLNPTEQNIFVVRSSYKAKIMHSLENLGLKSLSLISVDNTTSGQSITTKLSLDKCLAGQPVTISSCDHAVIYEKSKFDELMTQNIDIIVWGFKGYYSAMRNPKMYGWVATDENKYIRSTSIKKIPSHLLKDYVITGTFTFRSPEVLSMLIELQIKNENQVNGEYYLDSTIDEAIKLGLNCKVFEVSNYVCWGTPNELKTYEYWQSCFSKWSTHPYTNSHL